MQKGLDTNECQDFGITIESLESGRVDCIERSTLTDKLMSSRISNTVGICMLLYFLIMTCNINETQVQCGCIHCLIPNTVFPPSS